MAQAISVNVLQMPSGSSFSGTSNPCPVYLVATNGIQEVTAASAAQIALQPATASIITVNYYSANNVQTGTYWVSQSVATLLTAINAAS